mmetsp:Transcript_32097/g.83228  ORF Transcript_32097/g.83228 Transcript_32097/m.83228 type:complete len:806 (+) Transcript_32097:23-2440(+)
MAEVSASVSSSGSHGPGLAAAAIRAEKRVESVRFVAALVCTSEVLLAAFFWCFSFHFDTEELWRCDVKHYGPLTSFADVVGLTIGKAALLPFVLYSLAPRWKIAALRWVCILQAHADLAKVAFVDPSCGRSVGQVAPCAAVSAVCSMVLWPVLFMLESAADKLDEATEQSVQLVSMAETGQAADDAQYQNEVSYRQLLRVFQPYFWPTTPPCCRNRALALLTWVFVAGSKASNIVAPLFLASGSQALEKQLNGGGPKPFTPNAEVVVGLLMYAFLSFLSKGLKEAQSLAYIKVQQAAYVEIADRTFCHLHSLSLDWHLRKKMGNVIRSVDRGAQAAQQVMQYVFLYLFPTIAEGVAVILIFAFHFNNAALSVFCLFSLELYALVTIQVTLWRKKFRESMAKHDNEFHDRMTDSLINFETVKYFTNEEYERIRYRSAVSKYQSKSMATQASLSVLNIVQQIIVNITVGGGLLFAVWSVSRGTMDFGSFVAVNVYVLNLFQPLNFLGTIYNMLVTAVVDMKNFGELLAETPDIVDLPGAVPLRVAPGHAKIEFRAVHFHYRRQPTQNSLRDVSFVVPSGTTTALVGHTGAGKTTISRLLFRFYEPVSGDILLAGTNVRSVTQQSVRQSIGIVPQDVVMFNDTIEHNVRYASQDLAASDSDVMAAIEAAQLGPFIRSLESGLQTVVGERGLKLSGGEKQRLAIARCLLKNPPIILLDEATSALDSETEHRIQASLVDLRKDRTAVVIAHRLTTIRNADQIVVLDHGRVVEIGVHEELLAKGGPYQQLWDAQLRARDPELCNENQQEAK